MGMFNEIVCHMDLPGALRFNGDDTDNIFRTKDLTLTIVGHPTNVYTISPTGILSFDGKFLDYTGPLEFYGNRGEYWADVAAGMVIRVRNRYTMQKVWWGEDWKNND